MIGTVVFDVGECLVDESREYGTWADWLGVPRHTFSAVFGAVIARGLDYREAFQVFRPGFELDKARRVRADAGQPEWFGEDDLYPDVRPSLTRLRADGLWVGIAGNQTVRAGGILRELDLPADMIATSDDWGVSKPDPGFFRQVLPDHLRETRTRWPAPPRCSRRWALSGQLRRSNFHRTWDKARTSVGLPGLHFHDLRHTGGTLPAVAGATLKELMARPGHSSVRAALIYQHATRDRDQAIARALGTLVREVRGPAKEPDDKAERSEEGA